MWFLPFGIGLKINDLSKNLKNIMMNYDKFKNYEILIINSQVREIKNLKETIHKIECDAIKNNKDGDLTTGDYMNVINYLNAIKKENKIHYRAQIQNISTINLSNYYKLILWFVGFVALSAIIYKKIKK